jgi:hydrogenase-1 operon protein HyaE
MPSPLIEQLVEKHGYPRLTADNLDQTLQSDTPLVLFFTEEPKRYPESNDVAVVLPELVKAFPGRLKAVVVDRSLEPVLKDRYDIIVWPTLVFLRGGRFLDKITRIRDWSEYMKRIPQILDSEPGHNPGVDIPVVSDRSVQNHV